MTVMNLVLGIREGMKSTKCMATAIFGIPVMALLLVGCSTTSGYIGHGIMTEVQLNQANYTIVKSVTGTAEADYIFGIGPSEQDIMGQAKRDMLDKAKLLGSQAIINVTTDMQQTGFLMLYQKKVYVSAEVIQFK